MTKYCESCHCANKDHARCCRGCSGRFSGVLTSARMPPPTEKYKAIAPWAEAEPSSSAPDLPRRAQRTKATHALPHLQVPIPPHWHAPGSADMFSLVVSLTVVAIVIVVVFVFGDENSPGVAPSFQLAQPQPQMQQQEPPPREVQPWITPSTTTFTLIPQDAPSHPSELLRLEATTTDRRQVAPPPSKRDQLALSRDSLWAIAGEQNGTWPRTSPERLPQPALTRWWRQ